MLLYNGLPIQKLNELSNVWTFNKEVSWTKPSRIKVQDDLENSIKLLILDALALHVT